MAFHFAFEVPELNKYARIAYIYLSICTLYRYAHVTYISLFYSHSYSHSNHSSKTNSQTDTDKGTVTRRYRENVAIALMCCVCAQSVALLCSRPAKGAYELSVDCDGNCNCSQNCQKSCEKSKHLANKSFVSSSAAGNAHGN